MTRLVIDASVTAGFFFQDESDHGIIGLLRAVQVHGALVPAIWCFEAANLLRQGERKGRIETARLPEAIELLSQLPVEVDLISAVLALGPILTLARRHTLTAYDASYLELALRRGLPLATRDEAMIRAAKAEATSLMVV